MMELKQCKVLLVDDIKANVNILAKTLKGEYDIDYVTDGESALKYAESSPPDLILLDILMSGMDGYEVSKRLNTNERTKNIPIIFITSKNGEEDESKGLELGAVDYITKPFSKPIVRARVKNHLILKKQRDFLENLSNLDGLTGIPNRRSFDKVFDTEWRRAVRSHTPISLIMMDIDFFKKYNDSYGHAAGDDCLKQVAQALAKSIKRPQDFIARYGGEEFVALLPESDSKGALTVANIIQDNIESLGIQHCPSTVNGRVTISQGAATIVPTLETTSSLVLEAADKALYEAKEKGRNRVKSVVI
jgi:diguanylate cyclase (GGDEF)-like protein